jgi:hypothetical protein
MRGTLALNYQILMLLSVTACLCAPMPAFCDEELLDASQEQLAPTQDMKDVAEVGSAAGFDNRLPPVIPGENIQHNGRTMKVWSSAGPVPVGPAPSAPSAPQAPGSNQALPNVGVIVDQRPFKGPNR